MYNFLDDGEIVFVASDIVLFVDNMDFDYWYHDCSVINEEI